jgi:hypothetical protein
MNSLFLLTQENTAFSRKTPGLQLAWDSTSLGKLKTCPYKYYLSMIEGFASKESAIALQFGILFHRGQEIFHKAYARGEDFNSALRLMVREILIESKTFTADDPKRNRYTLLRSLVWYFENYREDPAKTVVLADDTPAVELSFRFATPFQSSEGEAFFLSGHLDRVVELSDHLYVTDYKTTGGSLGSYFFANFTPSNQMSLYSLAGAFVLPKKISGVIIDGIQLGSSFARFARGFANRTEENLSEWYDDAGFWMKLAEVFARAETWPMNDTACSMYSGCEFREACSKAPSIRKAYLESTFVRRTWDPLKVREV